MNTAELLAWARSADACANAIVWLAARDQSEPAETAIRAARLDWREWAAIRHSTPPTVLAVLAADSSEWVRRGVASNWSPNVPPEALAALMNDADEYVRQWADINPNTPKAKVHP